jgi:hypothetical protein
MPMGDSSLVQEEKMYENKKMEAQRQMNRSVFKAGSVF